MESCKKHFRPRQFLVGGMVFVSANIKGMKRGIRKQFCGDAVAEALCAIGQRRGSCDPAPWDFTEEERFKMFKHLMHSHVYPGANLFGYDGRTTYSWTYSIWTWQHGGKRKFVKEVWAAAQAELAEADYEVYDLTPIRCLIGDSGPRFCRMLAAEDAAAMGQRMNGMEADLAMLDKKLKRLYGGRGAPALPAATRGLAALPGEFRYRIALYNNVYEAVICGGKGGMLWRMLMP